MQGLAHCITFTLQTIHLMAKPSGLQQGAPRSLCTQETCLLTKNTPSSFYSLTNSPCLLSNIADSKVGLEAQQRYSTGYIQCMHEVHNLLLTCEWMDKTLGARLLNHLLKSLPRSGEDTCKAVLRSSSPSQQPLLMPKSSLSSKGSTQGTNPSQEHFYPAENKQASKNSFQLPSLSVFSQVDAAPPRQVLQPNFSHNNPRMGSLDMWRPW